MQFFSQRFPNHLSFKMRFVESGVSGPGVSARSQTNKGSGIAYANLLLGRLKTMKLSPVTVVSQDSYLRTNQGSQK